MIRRPALALLLALIPGLASAQFATIAPTPPTADNGDRIATTAWARNFLSGGLLLPSGQIFIGSVGGLAVAQTPSGDLTVSTGGVFTLATVNGNTGAFGSATQCVTVTNNAKGLTTAVSAATCTPAIGSITGLGTGIATALGVNVGTAGSVIVNGGALGTPSSGTLTSATGLPISTGLTGAGTGVLTALGVNVGSAGALVTFNGAGGTPSSMTATNLSGTASSLTAGNATNTAIIDDTTTNATMFPTWVTANTGNLPQKVTSTKLSFNPSTGALSSTSFTGAGTGLTGTAAGLTAGSVTTNANLTGPITSVGNATTVTSNSITNAMRAQMAAHTVKGNNGGSTANEADLTIPQLAAQFTSPTTSTCASVGAGCNNGGFGGSGTYTTPANVTWIEVFVVGGGGGGAGSGTSPGAPGAGVVSTFGSSLLTANGGAAGLANGAAAAGGTATGGDDNLTGGSGSTGGTTLNQGPGGAGGVNPRGGNGPSTSGGLAGISAIANTGAGGSGGGVSSTNPNGGGGAAGGWLRKIISSPSATYLYAVGGGGIAGTAGTGGSAGGAGGSGFIQVIEHYN